ncbi:MAG: cell wall hydrolase [Saccharofermentans sp.]|nr:cell wall hydrolase [Saccharofermentans sp.]
MRKSIVAILLAVCVLLSFNGAVLADVCYDLIEGKPTEEELMQYDLMWQNADDETRYYMDSKVKARAVGLSNKEFKFFARVVEAEGRFCEDEITDKVLVACVVINRTNCSRWPTSTITRTLQRKNQFATVNPRTHNCTVSRTLDSEWAIIVAYRLINEHHIDCHMVYFNSIGFGGTSSRFTPYVDCRYCRGNCFSCIFCDCKHCTEYCEIYDPEWSLKSIEMIEPRYERPIGHIEASEIVYLGSR